MGPLGVWKGQPPNASLFSYSMGRGSYHTPAPERFTLRDNEVVSFLADTQIHHGKVENSSSFLTFPFLLFYPQEPQFLCHEVHQYLSPKCCPLIFISPLKPNTRCA